MKHAQIVLIDDDLDDLDILREAIGMEHRNLQCKAFRIPDEAIEFLKSVSSNVPRVIFLDINMPRMSGDICLAEIRKLKGFDETIIAILSTSVSTPIKDRLTKLGATYVLEKPAHFADLKNLINKVIKPALLMS